MTATSTDASPSDYGDYCFPSTLQTTSSLNQHDIDSLLTPFREEAMHSNDLSERLLFHDEPSERLLFQDEDDVLESNRPSMNRSSSHGFGAFQNKKSSLNGLNGLNIASYVIHVLVVYGIGIWGLGGKVLPTWIERTQQHETLVMPDEWIIYACWYPILVLEGLFCVAQLFPYFRARPIIHAGTGYYFFYTTLFQTVWILFYCAGLFIPSFLAILAALLSLFSLLLSQEQQLVRNTAGRSNVEYLLFRLPFYWETGWMVVLAVHHFSLLFRVYDACTSLKVAVDIFSLGLLMLVAVLMSLRGKDLVFPLVIIAAYISIACRLDHPSHHTLELLVLGQALVMDAFRIACYFFAGTVTCCVIPIVVIWVSHNFCTIQVVELLDDY